MTSFSDTQHHNKLLNKQLNENDSLCFFPHFFTQNDQCFSQQKISIIFYQYVLYEYGYEKTNIMLEITYKSGLSAFERVQMVKIKHILCNIIAFIPNMKYVVVHKWRHTFLTPILSPCHKIMYQDVYINSLTPAHRRDVIYGQPLTPSLFVTFKFQHLYIFVCTQNIPL